MPARSSPAARVRVDADGELFFNISRSFVLAGCPADFNHDGTGNSQDFFDYLTAFFAGSPSADFNQQGGVNSQDFFDFLTAFFAGCA